MGAYESRWYTTSKKFKMGLIHIMQIAKNPQKLSAGGLADLNNVALVHVCKFKYVM